MKRITGLGVRGRWRVSIDWVHEGTCATIPSVHATIIFPDGPITPTLHHPYTGRRNTAQAAVFLLACPTIYYARWVVWTAFVDPN